MSNLTVLVIEDDENIRTLYADGLAGAGLTVFTAADGREGVSKALKEHPQVILVDILLPKINGHQVVEKIRADSWGRSAHIIYLTNLSDAENVVHAIEQNPEEYIVKANTSVKEIVNKVRTAMYT